MARIDNVVAQVIPNSDDEHILTPTSSTQSDETYDHEEATINLERTIFQGEEALKIFEVLDVYKQYGLENQIITPKLILVGAKSCGKSSLMENLTGLSIPISYGNGTRFPFELACVRDSESLRITPSILLADEQGVLLQQSLRGKVVEFNSRRSLTEMPTLSQLERLFVEVTQILGQPDPLFAKDHVNMSISMMSPLELSKHVFRFEIRGPNINNLIIVDTPGLHWCPQNGSPSLPACKRIVQSMLDDQSSILVAVMDVSQPVSCQELFGYAGMSGHVSERVVGVMTKCDLASTLDTDSFEATIARANNQEIFIPGGWHVVKNRSSSEAKSLLSLEGARRNEETLFATQAWKHIASGLDPSRVGISALQASLCKTLCAEITSQFPQFNLELENHISAKWAEITQLEGPLRVTEARREYLKTILAQFQDIKLQSFWIEHTSQWNTVSNGPVEINSEDPRHSLLPLLTAPVRPFDCVFSMNNNLSRIATTPPDVGISQNETSENIYAWIGRHYQENQSDLLPHWPTNDLILVLFREQTCNGEDRIRLFMSSFEDELATSISKCLRRFCPNQRLVAKLVESLTSVNRAKIRSIADTWVYTLKLVQEKPELWVNEIHFTKMFREAQSKRLLAAIASMNMAPNSQSDLDDIYGTSDDGREQIFSTFSEFAACNKEKFEALLTPRRQIVDQIHDTVHLYYRLAIDALTNVMFRNCLNEHTIWSMIDSFSDSFISGLSDCELSAICVDFEPHREKKRELEEDIRNLEAVISRSEALLAKQSIS